MEIFKQLNKLGYKHYVDLTIEELDKLPIDRIKRRIECSLIIDWFREKHKIDIYPEPTYSLTEYSFKVITVHGKSKKQEYWDGMGKTYNTYQEAREQAILKAIELIKEK